jgi:hypothetical protein
VHELDQPGDGRGAIECRPRPRACEVAPLDQLEAARRSRSIGPSSSTRRPERAARAPQRAADAFRRILELLLKPRVERFLEQTLRLSLGQHAKQRIDARLDRPLAQQIGTESRESC